MPTPSATIQVMMDAARKASKGLLRDFGEVAELQISKKGPADYVTAADLRCEQTLFSILSKARPGYGFLGEEKGAVEGSDKTHRWIVDPLDGTTNFMHSIPHFAITIALEREGEVVAGITMNPVSQDMFWAEKGKGAFLGGERRLRVAARSKTVEAVIATGIPFHGKTGHGRFLKELHQVGQRVSGVRRFGSAALDLAWVAAGRYDAYWERDLNPWDTGAGILLVTEAGGRVTDADGTEGAMFETGSILAANLDLHPKVLELLKAAA